MLMLEIYSLIRCAAWSLQFIFIKVPIVADKVLCGLSSAVSPAFLSFALTHSGLHAFWIPHPQHVLASGPLHGILSSPRLHIACPLTSFKALLRQICW